MAAEDELLVLAEDQRIRDAYVELRSAPPELRDFTQLEELLAPDESAYLREGFNEIWGDSVELSGRTEVLRQQTFRRSDDEMLVRSCERVYMLRVQLYPSEELSYFTGGNVGCVRESIRLFRRGSIGRWRHAGTLQRHEVPECRDIERICDGYADDFSMVVRPPAVDVISEQQRHRAPGLVHAIVDLNLSQSERKFRLPAAGTRSLLFRFGTDTYAGLLTSAGDVDFQPGGDHRGATVEFWHADASQVVLRAAFVVWCRADVGVGVVTSIVAHP